MQDLLIGVVGLGTMGAGIAQVAIEHDHEVVVHDVDEAAIERGRRRIADGLARRAAKLGLDTDSIEAWVDGRLASLRAAETLALLGAETDVVIEAALEALDLKRDIFRALDAAAQPDAILATNTSALPVSAIAAGTARPGRVIGLHFFNPVPVMPLVEVVVTRATDPGVVERAVTLVRSWGKTPVRCADSPGFIVNRVNRPYTLEALAMLESGVAGVEAIDAALREAGFPMGPFELMDLVGIDVNLAAARGVHAGFTDRDDPLADRFRPSKTQERLVADGRLGRKTGEGFYTYDTRGKATGPSPAFADPPGAPGTDASIVERVVVAIVAEACRMATQRTATADDIDLALRLGAGHPIGPFERLDTLGGESGLRRRLEALSALGPRFAPLDEDA